MTYRHCVRGVVKEQGSGRPLLDLVVRAFDADLLTDDLLGETRTDADGIFTLAFNQSQFRGLVESKPDLYVVVLDPSGTRVLHSTRSQLRKNASPEESYTIEIDSGTL